MKIAMCWTTISGYMAACWRALALRPEIEMSIVGFQADAAIAAFSDDLVRGLGARLLTPTEWEDEALVGSLVAEMNPDVVVIPGWTYKAYRRLVENPRLSRAKFIMTMDTPYRRTLRQVLGRYRISRLLSRVDRVIVTGERSWQLARVLGIDEARIRRGLYGVDYARFAPLIDARRAQPGGWPRRFLYAGRYHPEKGVDVLLAAYRAYRSQVSDPWPLTCCGSGPLASTIDAEAGVTNLGFVQPTDQPPVLASHGVFVLASRFDPWPLVVAEAGAAGLPVIHTEACGSAVELVRPYFNGLGVATEDVASLTAALRWCHEHHDKLPEMGARAQPLAAAYSAEAWADRWVRMFQELCDAG